MTTRKDTAEESETKVRRFTPDELLLGEVRLYEVVGVSQAPHADSPSALYLQDRHKLDRDELLAITPREFVNHQDVLLEAGWPQDLHSVVGCRLLIRKDERGLVIAQIRYGRTP